MFKVIKKWCFESTEQRYQIGDVMTFWTDDLGNAHALVKRGEEIVGGGAIKDFRTGESIQMTDFAANHDLKV